MLNLLHEARLNEAVKTKGEELALIQRHFPRG
jgi:hypothetical protein